MKVTPKPEIYAARGIPNPEWFRDLSLRTLFLMMGDYSHAIDKMQETGKPIFAHTIDREYVEREVRAMMVYILQNRNGAENENQ